MLVLTRLYLYNTGEPQLRGCEALAPGIPRLAVFPASEGRTCSLEDNRYAARSGVRVLCGYQYLRRHLPAIFLCEDGRGPQAAGRWRREEEEEGCLSQPG